jgi:CRISPR-associated protein (TIGR02710 family)
MIGLNHELKKPKAMFASLGGAPAPIIKSLNYYKPDYICFLVSEQTQKDIETVMRKLEYRHIHYDWITTPAAEGLSETFKVIYSGLDAILSKWGVGYEDLIVDYTGGTKTMSASIVLATIDKIFRYSYVGGTERTKEGVGIVIDGKERMLFSDNPWNEMAVIKKKEVNLLFNHGRYATALDAVKKIIPMVTPDVKPFFEWVADAIEGYKLLDRFSHRDALNRIGKSLSKLEPYAMSMKSGEGIKEMTISMKKNKEFLDVLVNDKERQNEYKVFDLLANARRRANENRYDDAVARLYRVIEAYAQFKLESKYGIKTSDVKLAEIPEDLKEVYIKKYKDENDERIKLPLYASYELLKYKGDEVGIRFFQQYDATLKRLLDTRNSSILAHGFVSVKEETFKNMYDAILSFTDIKGSNLPEFPEFKL